MAGQLTKAKIGKEDLQLQDNTNAVETYERISSTGSQVTYTKFPDIWEYTGAIRPGDIITKGPWHDVRAYGAIGDGIVDDTAAIQAAITAASAGDTIIFPGANTATYLVSQITVNKSLHLLFGLSTLKAKSTQPAGGLLHITSSDVSVYDLIIDGNSSAITGDSDRRAIQIHTASGTINNFFLSNVTIDDVAGGGIYINRVTDLTAIKVKITNAGQKTDKQATHPWRSGIYVSSNSGNADITFLDCNVSSNGGCGFYFDNPSTRINVIGGRANSNGWIGLAGVGSTYVKVIGLIANSNTDNGIDFGGASGKYIHLIGCTTNSNGDAVTNAGLFMGDNHAGEVIIEGHEARENAGTGILLSYTNSTSRVNCFNSISGDNARDGFALLKITNSQFRGNYAYDSQGTATQRYHYFFSNITVNVDGNEHDGNAVTASFYLSGTNVFLGDVGKTKEVATGTFTLAAWGPTEIDSSGGAVSGTLGSGYYIGQIKTIVMTDASTSSTVSITNHQTSDPEVATFDAVDETGVFMWTGTEWITIFATCTFV